MFNLDSGQKSAVYFFGCPWFESSPLHCCGLLLRLERLYSPVRFFVSQFVSPHSKKMCPSATRLSKSEPSLSGCRVKKASSAEEHQRVLQI